jgi:hypothetical protein
MNDCSSFSRDWCGYDNGKEEKTEKKLPAVPLVLCIRAHLEAGKVEKEGNELIGRRWKEGK